MAKSRPDLSPEWLTATETAEKWFGVDYDTFKKRLPELEARGFPSANAFGKRYVPALRTWAERVYDIDRQDSADMELGQRLREFEHG